MVDKQAREAGDGESPTNEKGEPRLPEMDFSTFVVSLSASTMIHLGDEVAEGSPAQKNLPLAKQTIDILAMLEEKTRGNLTPQEARLISQLLYDLRLRYVRASK